MTNEFELIYLISCGCPKAYEEYKQKYISYLNYLSRKYYGMYSKIFSSVFDVHVLIIEGFYEANKTYIDTYSAPKTHITNRIKFKVLNYVRKFTRTGRYFNTRLNLSALQDGGMEDYFMFMKQKGLDQFDTAVLGIVKDSAEEKLTKEEIGIFSSYIDGFSYEEMAEKYSMSRKHLDNKLQKIKRIYKAEAALTN